ncbi:hypothetical protein [Escherichia coli]|uniref:hypothetical protein n=1 Tax=Escherichia coli TaxID=562 RepID=UPI0012FF9997|nr:hypothetical protein [Escherichia coli]
MKKNKKCVFCGKSTPEIKFTNEHILPKWLQKHVNDTDSHTFTSKSILKKPINRIGRGKKSLDLTVNRICNECNNGWMSSKIESPIKPILLSMIKAEKITLCEAQIKLLALWSVKTCLVRSLVDDANAKGAVESHFNMVRHGLIPDNVMVWAVKIDSWSTPVKTRHIFYGDRFYLGEAMYKQCIAYSSSVTIENLSLHVLALPDNHNGLIYHFDALKENLPDSSAMVWPILNNQLVWPFKKGISFDPKEITQRLAETYILA